VNSTQELDARMLDVMDHNRTKVMSAEIKSMPMQTALHAAEEYQRYTRRKRRQLAFRRAFRGALGILVILVIWEAMSRAFSLDLILPRPFSVVTDLVKTLLVANLPWLYGPNIYLHLLHSFLRAMIGFGFAAMIGIPLGLFLGRITTAREYIMPLVRGLYPIPGIAWIPLAILWFGLGDETVVFVVFASAIFPLIFSTEAGARRISPVVLDAGRCFGARGLKLFLQVILPASVPYIITGLRVALGTAWRMVVAGEMLASPDGIGFLLVESRFQFRAADLMTVMIVVAVVGYLTEKVIVDTLEKRTIEKWDVATS
jgi:ABC-type nitrate/sulfonate/bicarbonate transport system permease component